MTEKNSNEHILSALYDIRAELQKVVEPQERGLEELTARDWLDYDKALRNVHLAIAALEKGNNSEINEFLPKLNTSKKGVLSKIAQIKIDGKPDWSQRCKRGAL